MKKAYLIGLCLLVCLNMAAQQPTIPDRPTIDRVTVHPETGVITIVWSTTDISPIPVEEFVLFWYEHHPAEPESPSSTAHAFAKEPFVSFTGTYIYEFRYEDYLAYYEANHDPEDPKMPNPRTNSVGFSVSAVNYTPSYSTSLRAYDHYNVTMNSMYDSCRSEIRLNWQPYRGWLTETPPNFPLTGYRIMRIPEGGSMPGIEIATLSHRDTFFVLRNVDKNEFHNYYIEARRDDGIISTSFSKTRYTEMPTLPSFVNAWATQYDEDGFAQIYVEVDPAAETHGYLLSGTDNPNFPPVPIAEFTIDNNTVITDIQSRGKTFYYRLDALHICSGQPPVRESNKATALWLSIQQNGLINNLSWHPYQQWENSDVYYEVHRKIGDREEKFNVGQMTSFVDDLSELEDMGEEVCYWIKATPTSPSPLNEFAISYINCVEPESTIVISNAFIPDTDGLNSRFTPTFDYPPNVYLLMIYDRTGAEVFRTTTPALEGQNIAEAGWNGYLPNGRPANEGVYTYFIRFTTPVGRVLERKGTFVLIRQ